MLFGLAPFGATPAGIGSASSPKFIESRLLLVPGELDLDTCPVRAELGSNDRGGGRSPKPAWS